MAQFEYKVVPAPKRGLKARGIKGTEAMFANALATLMNEAAADGWEYQRTDSLPCEERQGLTGRVTVFQNMLVFRRLLNVEAAAPVVANGIAVAVDMPGETAPAPKIERDVPLGTAPVVNAPVVATPDARVAETLGRNEAAMPAAPKAVGAAGSSHVAAE